MNKLRTSFFLFMATALVFAAMPTRNVLAVDDTLGPITSAVATSPNPAVVNSTVTVTATVDDSTTGGSYIQSAEFSVNGGAWQPLSVVDGAFDSVMENVTGSFTLEQSGDTEVCVRGTDVIPNIGDSACVTLAGQYEFTFKGFRPPVRMGVDNRANAPRTIPVKWRLTLSDGTPVSDLSSFVALKSYEVDCTTRVGDSSTAVVEPSLGSGLLYLGNGNWLFRWKTSKDYRHTCRVMFVEFSDGQTSPEVFFTFR
jgi:hypothetical protein